MKRRPEPELMTDETQVKAYAEADFNEPHAMVLSTFKKRFPLELTGYILDIGCGAADITIRFAKAFRNCQIDGVDGSLEMIRRGELEIKKAQLDHRVKLFHHYLTDFMPIWKKYDAIISNSLLHHLKEPKTLWEVIKAFGISGTPIFVMDLMRPDSENAAQKIVEEYSANEPEILKRDFYNSLLAAYTLDEVKEQLSMSQLNFLDVSKISDRHLSISGFLR